MAETAASLALLKGSKKDAVEKQLETAPAVETEDAVEVDVDIDSLDMETINELVDQYNLEVPSNWASMKLEQKKEWLRSHAEETPAPETPATAEDQEFKGAGVVQTTGKPEKKAAKEKKPKAEKSKPEAYAEAAATALKHNGLQQVDPATLPKTTSEAMEQLKSSGALTPEKADKKAKKEKSKAVAKSETLSGEIMDGDDLIVDIVHEVETMNETDARKTVSALAENTEKTYFKLGGVLSVILKNKWYAPYGHFRDLVENEYGINYRKAMYLISIYDHLVESKVPWSKVKEIGWAKLKELADIITLDNADEWVQIAKSQPQLKFMETVKAAKQGNVAITDQSQSSPTTVNKTFKVHSGQKETIEAAINKAKEDSNTTVDTVALENICLEYLGGVTIKNRLQKMGLDAALKTLEEAFPDANLNIEVAV